MGISISKRRREQRGKSKMQYTDCVEDKYKYLIYTTREEVCLHIKL